MFETMNLRGTLFVILVAVLSFKAGMVFNHWLHRPISAGGFTVLVPVGNYGPCFRDKPEECAPPKPAEPKKPEDTRSEWERTPDFGTFPPNRNVCSAGNTICWYKT